jgi:Flp pilus assembly protein TadD
LAGIIFLLLAGLAEAQVNVRGQILLPNGLPPTRHIQFELLSDDGMVNEIRHTDSSGRFILERLRGNKVYIIKVRGDGVEFGDTTYDFTPNYMATPRVTLEPVRRKPEPKEKNIVGVSTTASRTASAAAKLQEEAQVEIRREQYAAAEELLRKAIAADPKYVPAFVDLGAVLMRQKKFTDAEKYLRTAIELDARAPLAHLNLGVVLNRQNRFTEAVPPLRQALVLDPESSAAHAHLGIALLEIEEYKEAEDHLLRGLKATGTEELLCDMYLGNLYARTGKYAEAIRYFEIYLQRLPNAANAGEVRELVARMKKQLAAPN